MPAVSDPCDCPQFPDDAPRVHEWRKDETSLDFTASSKEFAASAFLGRPQLAALNVPDFRNWNQPSPRAAQAMDNVTPMVATLAAYGEQVGSQWVYNQRPRQSRYLGGTAQGGFVLLPPEVGIDSFGDSFQPTNIGTLSKPYFTLGPGARLGIGPPDLADGTVNDGWSMSWFMNSEINLDAGLLLRGNDLCVWRHASAPTPAFAIFHSGANQGDIAWKSNTDYWGIFAHANTGNRVYTFPDVTGTVALTGSTVASITGTANQVLANGTSGSAEVGAVTLTTPQDIGTASDVLFKNLDLTAQLKIRSASNQIILDSDAAVNIGTITMAVLSAARAWTFPDATGTVVLGTGTANQLAYWGSTNGITGDAGLTYDATNDKLSLLNSSTNVTPMLEVEQASTGDTGARFTLTGGNSFMLGIDNSDSDKFKISYGSAGNAVLGTNDYFVITTTDRVGIRTASPSGILEIADDGTTEANVLMRNTAVGSNAPFFQFLKTRAGGSVSVSDGLGTLEVLGMNSTPAQFTGARYIHTVGSATAASEGVYARMLAIVAGTERECIRFGDYLATGQPGVSINDGQVDLDFVVRSDNFSSAIFVDASTDIVQVENELRVGTATDTVNQGDISAGLTGGNRLYWDRTNKTLSLIDSTATRIKFLAAGESYIDDGTLVIGDTATLAGEILRVHQSGSDDSVILLTREATNDDINEDTLMDRVTTTDATVTTLQTIPLTASRTYTIESSVYARRTGGTAGTAEDGAGYVIRSTWNTIGGVTTIIGAVNADYTAENQAAWDATHVSDGAGNVLLRVTGAANNNVTWHHTTRVRYVGS